jgi:hypothetical protein
VTHWHEGKKYVLVEKCSLNRPTLTGPINFYRYQCSLRKRKVYSTNGVETVENSYQGRKKSHPLPLLLTMNHGITQNRL